MPRSGLFRSLKEAVVTSSVDLTAQSDLPPDGGAGWLQVAVAFTINCFTWGQTSSFAVYLSYYLSNDTFPEGRPLDYAFVGGLQFALAMLVAPLVTILARRLGTKPPMVFGIALQMGGFIFASFATRIWELYLSQGVLLGLGLGFIFVPSTPILSQWFSKRRSLVVGISSAGSGVGGIMFSLASQAMITHISLPWAFRITAILVGVMLLTAVLLLRDRNHIVKTTHAGFDTKLLVRSDVLLMLAWAFLSMLGYTTLLYSLPDFAKSLGLSGSRAATVNALLNLGVAVGRPMIGLVSDRLGRIKVAAAATMICGLSCFAIWIPANSYGVTIFFALFSGALVGVFWMTVAPIAAEIVGLAEVPSLLSITWLAIVLPILFAEVIALELRRSGSDREYLYPQIFTALAFFLASLCLFGLWWQVRHRTSKA